MTGAGLITVNRFVRGLEFRGLCAEWVPKVEKQLRSQWFVDRAVKISEKNHRLEVNTMSL